MKPNKNQLLVIESIRSTIGFWESTNDLDSPTHLCDIDECTMADLGGILPDDKISQLCDALQTLYFIIKNTK